MDEVAEMAGNKRWHAPWEMHCIKIRIRRRFLLSCGERKGELAGEFTFGGERCAGRAYCRRMELQLSMDVLI